MANHHNHKVTNIALWTVQGLLAASFLMAGVMKAAQPIEVVVESIPSLASTPEGLIRFIGISEIAGALGLLIPSIFRFKPFLTVWAALGLALVMVLAVGFHAVRAEWQSVGVNVILLLLALFIAWGRSAWVPVLAKS
ncbi:putative membrane protein [Lewinella marina]|uniref:DoxX family protein n=1 Tax=Neolewinella marina TaxID=438751 RepID=A0A2G0CKR5_9BACT|nr:DoxX family protein [Neolewinella marina]NJB84316.1 putative membrane protein [Neolewinella marina]PHL00564.1 hypothetical protein CGL56_05480 [Neolewinella marina]